MKKLLGIVVLGLLFFDISYASAKSLTKKESKKFVLNHAITLKDERKDGVVTYIFGEENYERYKDFKAITRDAWRFSKLGALRLFNNDIKMTWKIKLGEVNEINIKTKFDPIGKLYEFTYQPKQEFLASVKKYEEEEIAKKELEKQKEIAKQKKIEEEKKRLEEERLTEQKKLEEEKKRLEEERLAEQKKLEDEKKRLEEERLEFEREKEELEREKEELEEQEKSKDEKKEKAEREKQKRLAEKAEKKEKAEREKQKRLAEKAEKKRIAEEKRKKSDELDKEIKEALELSKKMVKKIKEQKKREEKEKRKAERKRIAEEKRKKREEKSSLWNKLTGNDPDIERIKNGRLTGCPNKTINQMVDGFMSSPKWSSGIAKDNIKFVNVQGKMTYMEKPVTADIQFILKGENSFEFYALEFNEIPQNKLMVGALFNKMCGS